MNVDYNCYEGMEVQGVPETVLSRGKVVIENGNYVGKAGDGQFLKRSTVNLGPTKAQEDGKFSIVNREPREARRLSEIKLHV